MAVKTEVDFTLPPDLEEKAKAELNEVPEEISSRIKEFREAIEDTNKPDSPPFLRLEEDTFLLRFLRAKKYRQEDAVKQYLNYCKYRIAHPEIFEGLCLAKVKYIFQKKAMGILEHTTKNGLPVIVSFPRRMNIDEASEMNNVLGALLLIMERLLDDPATQVRGVVVVENWEGVGFVEMVKYQMVTRKESGKMLQLFQEAFPARFKGMWTLKEPWFMDMLYAIVKPFLSQKMKDRVKFFGKDVEKLYQHIPAEHLPEEFGGTLPPFSEEAVLKLMEKETTID